MDPEMKRLIEETRALARDNHDMLRAIRRDQWFGFAGRIIIWIIVLGLPLFLYQKYLEPIVTSISSSAGVSVTGPFGFPTMDEAQRLFQSLTSPYKLPNVTEVQKALTAQFASSTAAKKLIDSNSVGQ